MFSARNNDMTFCEAKISTTTVAPNNDKSIQKDTAYLKQNKIHTVCKGSRHRLTGFFKRIHISYRQVRIENHICCNNEKGAVVFQLLLPLRDRTKGHAETVRKCTLVISKYEKRENEMRAHVYYNRITNISAKVKFYLINHAS